MNKRQKASLIEALKATKEAYKNDTHRNTSHHCELCKLYAKNCSQCIMNVFSDMSAGCSFRLNCAYEGEQAPEVKGKMLIFYSSVIGYLKNVPAELIRPPFNLDNISVVAKEVRRIDYGTFYGS